MEYKVKCIRNDNSKGEIKMKITKQIEVFDKDVLKVGDKILVNENEGVIENVTDDKLRIKWTSGGGKIINVEGVKNLTFDKPKSKLDQFKIPDIYLVTDTLSCDTFRATVINTSNMNSVMLANNKTGKIITVKEDEIDTKYTFTKLNPRFDNVTSKDKVLKQADKKDEDIKIKYKTFPFKGEEDVSKEAIEKAYNDFVKFLGLV